MQTRYGKKFTIESYTENPKIFDAYIPYIKKNTDWYPKKIKTHLLFMLPQAVAAIGGVATKSPEGFKTSATIFRDGYLYWSYDPRDFRRMGNFLFQQSQKDPLWINRYLADFRRSSKKLQRVIAQVQCNALPTTAKKLRVLVVHLFNALLDAQSYGYITEATTITLRKYWIIDYLKKLAPNLSSEEIQALAHPVADSFLKHFYSSLHIARSQKDFSNVLKKYYWIKGSYWSQPALSVATLMDEKKKHRHIEKDKKVSKRSLIEKATNPTRLKRFVHLLEALITLQDERKENAMRMNYALYRVARHTHTLFPRWSINDILSFSPLELLAFLDGKMQESYKKTVRQRNKKSAWVFGREGYTLRIDSRAIKVITQILKPKSTDAIKGFTANAGTVRGRVKVILSEMDFKKMKKGDILVTSMTRPEFMPVLRKASAFVTNEGGITCHAAIISREMNIPCIIGTKVATEVLHDGDLVEVNANSGVVKKIKNTHG